MRLAVATTPYAPASPASLVVCDDTIFDSWRRPHTTDAAAHRHRIHPRIRVYLFWVPKTICNCKAVHDGLQRFAAVKIKPATTALAVNNTILRAILALYCYCLSMKVDISVSRSCVVAVRNKYC